ncbi:MAG: hypothetical protein HY801_12155 [Candidatus Lindowbacteria bacterium]|nr:hypothetical protein [Candidatus Lindowbacteria bacterium]
MSISKQTERILDKIHAIGPFVMASLTVTKKRCSNPNCRCSQEGPIHEVALLTWKESQRTHTMYIRIDDRKEVRGWVAEGKRLKRLIKAMSEAQRKTLKNRTGRKGS